MADQETPNAAPAPLPPDTIRAAQQVRAGVVHLAQRLRRLRANHGVSNAKLAVLSRLYQAADPITAVELARLEQLQPQSLTRIIAELEERGLIARRADETDRRQMLLTITGSGRDLLTQDARAQIIWLARMMEANLTGMEAGVLALAGPLLERLAGLEEK